MLYKMKKDEKISDVVNTYDVPYYLITRYNRFVVSEDGVYVGRDLTLPRTYTVLPGDSYDSIVKTYRVLPSYLKELNPYMDEQSVIYPGQTIFLPPE
jgi:LysM repeat protein